MICLERFKINFFKLNADKCKLLISNKDNGFSMDIEGETIVCEQSVKLLGIKINLHLVNMYQVFVKMLV